MIEHIVIIKMINPVNRTATGKLVNSYKVEPYVIAADIYSAVEHAGRGGWTWYTGSAGWFYRVGIRDIIGLQKFGNTLKLNPKMPVHWDSFRLCYNYMDTTYNIEIIKSSKDDLILDGKSQISNTIELVNDKSTHSVIMYIK